MELPIELAAAIEAKQLHVSVENTSPETVRIWSRQCSWGYSTFSLLLARPAQPDHRHELTAKPIFWTVNFPRVVEIESGDRATFDLAPNGPEWLGLASLQPLKAETWEVRVRLRIPDTPEAREHRILIGESTSPPVISHPPHNWLFDWGGSE